MAQLDYQAAEFSYDGACDAAGVPAQVAIYGDRALVRGEIAADLGGAGFRTIDGGGLAALLEGPIALLGDVVMLDCPVADGASLAALARLDMRVARSGAQLIVSTSLDALEDVFGALDQSDPQILVEPSRAERVVAAGRVMAGIADPRVREMSEQDRRNLLQLSRQVDAIAQQLDRLSGRQTDTAAGDTTRVGDFKPGFRGPEANPLLAAKNGVGRVQPALPDPHLVRRLIAARQARARFFDAELFADPAWDMLLDLTAAHAERSRVSVTSLCIAAAVPATTALRWIKQLVDCGVFVRVADPSDGRRAFIVLSDQSVTAMARYFDEVEMPLLQQAA